MSEQQATYLCSLSAQELRIGNWVYDGERTQFPMQVVAIGKDWVQLDFPGNEGGVWESDRRRIEGEVINKISGTFAPMVSHSELCSRYLQIN